ncbi:Hypp9431, partial [Branchiostoma lanceolatum]
NKPEPVESTGLPRRAASPARPSWDLPSPKATDASRRFVRCEAGGTLPPTALRPPPRSLLMQVEVEHFLMKQSSARRGSGKSDKDALESANNGHKPQHERQL